MDNRSQTIATMTITWRFSSHSTKKLSNLSNFLGVNAPLEPAWPETTYMSVCL